MSISTLYDHPKFAGKTPPLAHGGEPPHDGDMEARIARLEDAMIDSRERLARIEATLPSLATKADIKDLSSEVYRSMNAQTWRMLGAFAAGFLILLGVMAHGFHWL